MSQDVSLSPLRVLVRLIYWWISDSVVASCEFQIVSFKQKLTCWTCVCFLSSCYVLINFTGLYQI